MWRSFNLKMQLLIGNIENAHQVIALAAELK